MCKFAYRDDLFRLSSKHGLVSFFLSWTALGVFLIYLLLPPAYRSESSKRCARARSAVLTFLATSLALSPFLYHATEKKNLLGRDERGGSVCERCSIFSQFSCENNNSVVLFRFAQELFSAIFIIDIVETQLWSRSGNTI